MFVLSKLGFTTGTAVIEAQFGQGTGRIWLDEVDCSGVTGSLLYCDHKPWGVTDCDHDEDIGVTCGECMCILG